MIKSPQKPPSPTPQREVRIRDDPAYWQALGQFIEAFSGVETVLFNYLCVLTRTPYAIAKVFFSGYHIDQLITSVMKVVHVLVITLDNDIHNKTDEALTQLAIINSIRNSVIHYTSFETSDKGRISSNVTRARNPNLIKEYRASVDTLKEAIDDLERISHLLIYCLLIFNEPNSPPNRADFASQFPALSASWRYKQP